MFSFQVCNSENISNIRVISEGSWDWRLEEWLLQVQLCHFLSVLTCIWHLASVLMCMCVCFSYLARGKNSYLTACTTLYSYWLSAGLFLRGEIWKQCFEVCFTPGFVTGLTSLPDNTCLKSELITPRLFPCLSSVSSWTSSFQHWHNNET